MKVSGRKDAMAALSAGRNAGIYGVESGLHPRYSLDVLEKK
jgi:hypothetical protein